MPRTHSSAPPRLGTIVGSVVASVALLLALGGSTATAAPPAVATVIGLVDVASNVPLPASGPNNPAVLIEQDETFSVTVRLFGDDDGDGQHDDPLPLSYNKSSTVTLTVTSAGDNARLGSVRTMEVPAGASTASAGGFILTPADNRVRLTATVTGGTRDAKAAAPGTSTAFDVVRAAYFVGSTQTSLNSDGGTGECEPTRGDPYCADLQLPSGSVDGTLLTVGECDDFLGCTSPDQLVVQVLAGLDGLYGPASPATLVFKCDKSACKGGGVSSYGLLVNLAATGELTQAPACSAKGVAPAQTVVDGELTGGYCVDYVQSKRSGAGDLYLYLLFVRDARMSCC